MIDSSEGRCGVVVSRNVVVKQIRSDPGSIPGISTYFLFSLKSKTLIYWIREVWMIGRCNYVFFCSH